MCVFIFVCVCIYIYIFGIFMYVCTYIKLGMQSLVHDRSLIPLPSLRLNILKKLYHWLTGSSGKTVSWASSVDMGHMCESSDMRVLLVQAPWMPLGTGNMLWAVRMFCWPPEGWSRNGVFLQFLPSFLCHRCSDTVPFRQAILLVPKSLYIYIYI